MKRLTYLCASFAALCFGLLFGLGIAGAFEPPNVPNWPGVAPSGAPMTAKVGATSEMTWEAVDQYGWSGWRNLVGRSLDTNSSDPQSLGKVLNGFLAAENRGQIVIREARSGEVPDMRHFAVATAVIEAKCGVSWSTACVALLSARPVPAWYKVAAMIVWAYDSQAAVVRHETHHAIATSCDQYRGGCPRASDGAWESSVICTGNPDTLMDCGGAARTATFFDYQTFVKAYVPSTPFLQIKQALDCAGPTDPSWGGVWDNCLQLWIGPAGWDFNPATGQWQDKQGGGEWCCVTQYRSSPDVFGAYNRRLDYWQQTVPSTDWQWRSSDPTWRCTARCP